MGNSILIVSGHDFRSPRKANIHFIASELSKNTPVRFLSIGFSDLSLFKADPRTELTKLSNRVGMENGVECFLWKTLIHPFNMRVRSLRFVERAHFDFYRSRLPEIPRRWMREARIIIIESGLGVMFIEMIRRLNRDSKIIYNASDDLAALDCSAYLRLELARVAGCIDWVRVPSRLLAERLSSKAPLFFIPHGIHHELRDQDDASPFESGIHAVSVGSMLFDRNFFELAADLFPDVHFHVIGAGTRSRALSGANIHVYGEMKFRETVKFIKNANFCIAAYSGGEHPAYLADTSMKLLQYDFLGLPAVCPSFVAGNHSYRIGYEPGDRASIKRAIEHALAQRKHTGSDFLSWEEVTKRLLDPGAYPEARVQLIDRPGV